MLAVTARLGGVNCRAIVSSIVTAIRRIIITGANLVLHILAGRSAEGGGGGGKGDGIRLGYEQ